MSDIEFVNEEPDQIWLSISIKKNLGNYESLGLDAGGKVTVKPGTDKADAWKSLWAEVEAQIEEQLVDSGLKKR